MKVCNNVKFIASNILYINRTLVISHDMLVLYHIDAVASESFFAFIYVYFFK